MYPVIIVAVYVMLALGLNIVVGSPASWTWASWPSTPWGLRRRLARFIPLPPGQHLVRFDGLHHRRGTPGIHISFWLILIIAGPSPACAA